jgi:hypothetical protein
MLLTISYGSGRVPLLHLGPSGVCGATLEALLALLDLVDFWRQPSRRHCP